VCDVFILYNSGYSYMLLINEKLIKVIICGNNTVCDVFKLYNLCYGYRLLIKKEFNKLISEMTYNS
jgi:hypothetical protein